MSTVGEMAQGVRRARVSLHQVVYTGQEMVMCLE